MVAATLLVVGTASGVVLLHARPAAATTVGDRIVAAARAELGKPYCFDGGDANGPTHGDGGPGCAKKTAGFDCSGLAMYAYAQADITLTYHYTDNEYDDILAMGGKVVTASTAAPGSLIFFHTTGDSPAYFHHVAIYSGNGMLIEAAGYKIPQHETHVYNDDGVVFVQPPQLNYWNGNDWFAYHGYGERMLSNTLSGRTVANSWDGWYGTTPLTGDWDGNRTDTDGFWDRNTGWFYASNTQYGAGQVARFGRVSDMPVVGDWTGTGHDTFGIYRPSTAQWFLQLHGLSGAFTLSDTWGGDNMYQPVVGDWNGDGRTTLGLRRVSDGVLFFGTTTTGIASIKVRIGDWNDLVVVGDWDGNGTDTPGVYRPSTHRFYLSNSLSATVLPSIGYGAGIDYPFVGDWDGNGKTTLGVVLPT